MAIHNNNTKHHEVLLRTYGWHVDKLGYPDTAEEKAFSLAKTVVLIDRQRNECKKIKPEDW